MVSHWHDTMRLAPPSEPVHLHIVSEGSGPVVLFAHGFGGSARNFMPQARELRLSHKIWLYDTRGHARSGTPETTDAYGWPALLSDFDTVVQGAVRDATNVEQRPLVVGGLSLGAATALLWALQTNVALDGLVLAAYPESSESQRQWAQSFADAIEAEGLEKAGERFVWGASGTFARTDASAIRRGFMEHAPQALAGILRMALANIPDIVSLAPTLSELRIPTLIVVGGEDALSLEPSRALATQIPGSQLAIIENAGHVVNLSQPRAFNRELAAFLANLSSIAMGSSRQSTTRNT
jgi:pimeloyl-ACP methyl ester carboxylesterase